MNQSEKECRVTRPALSYHGGKWLLAPWIIERFPPHRVYVEPFGGGASVLLRKVRAYAEVYNDMDDDVVNFFRVLRDPVKAEQLRDGLVNTPFSRTEFSAAYEIEGVDEVERARRMVVRSFMGFGSASTGVHYSTGFRANSNRSGTTPAHDWVNYPDGLAALTARLRGVVIENRSYEKVIEAHDGEETLFYVDPPYPMCTRNCHRDSYRYEMTDEEHVKLSECLKGVRGMVVLSGYQCPLYDELFEGWRREERRTYADGAALRMECLWLNENAVASLCGQLTIAGM